MLQGVIVCCRALKCSVLQFVVVCCSTYSSASVCVCLLQRVVVCSSVVCCSVL